MAPPIVKKYLIAFDKHKWVGLASFGLVVVGSSIVAVQPEPPASYIADAALSYTRPPVSFSATGNEIQQQGQELNEGFLLSEPIIVPVAEKIKMKPEILQKSIGVVLPKKTKTGELESPIIELKFKDKDKKQAAETLQDLMIRMVKASGELNTEKLKQIINKINERLPQAKKELEEAEKKLEVYDRKERPAILSMENGSLLEAINLSQSQQRQIQLTLSGIDAQIRSIQSKLGLSVEQAYLSSALSADPIIADIRSKIYQTESQIELLKKDLRPEHPTMVQLKRSLDAAQLQLQQRAQEVVGGAGVAAPIPGTITALRNQINLDPARQQLANQLVGLQTQRETLQKQYADQVLQEGRLRKEYSLIPNKQLERSRLEQQVLLKKAIYDQMQVKITDAKAAEAETVSSLTIARPPSVAIIPVPPKSVPVTLGIGSFLGLVVGGGVVFLLGSLEGTLKTKEDIRDSIKQRDMALLGELPILPVDDLQPDEVPTVLSANSPYLEYYEKFRSNLRRIGGKDKKIILIASTGAQEGKTLTAYNLAIASARAGKRTLIIETDLRSPSHSKSLKVAPDPEASLEPLRYYNSLSDCIRLVPDIENLYIIPSPGPVRHSAAILESSEIRRLMEDARSRYDLVLLDTHSLSLSNDALLMQPYSDGIILVTRPIFTQETMMGEAIDQLVEAELGLIGVVVNGADITVTASEFKSPMASDKDAEAGLGIV
jgi:capsular exopolysaccharide synthesis family protein